MHGGASTGPRTPEGRKRLSELALARYIEGALVAGWAFASPACQEAVVALKRSLGGMHNTTARVLGVSGHAVRRMLAGLPSRPEELEQILSVLTQNANFRQTQRPNEEMNNNSPTINDRR
jgi:hypothetical protein